MMSLVLWGFQVSGFRCRVLINSTRPRLGFIRFRVKSIGFEIYRVYRVLSGLQEGSL